MTTPQTFIFDCDGVVLDSNHLKTEAFRKATLPYGTPAAEAMVAHHVANGGVSRYLKFLYFSENILESKIDEVAMERLLSTYAEAVREGLSSCEVTPGLADLRARFPDSRWCIVSGGDQAELRDVFAARGLDVLFDAGIFGSPERKEVILNRLIAEGVVPERAVFIGDSKYDHIAAKTCGVPMVFVAQWSEFRDWQTYTKAHNIPVIERVADLAEFFDSNRMLESKID